MSSEPSRPAKRSVTARRSIPAKRPTAAKSRRTNPYVPRGGKVPAHDLRIDGYLHIGDYGLIGDCRSVALVGADGGIDWCCLPRFDSPSLFGRLLDARKGGSWALAPTGEHATRQEYYGKTNILRTIFQTPDGMATITDFMPVDDHDVQQHARPHEHPRIVRIVTGLSGKVRFRQHIDPRPDYGRGANPLRPERGRLHGDFGDHHICVSGSLPLRGEVQEFNVIAGQTVTFGMAFNHVGHCGRALDDVEDGRQLLRNTQEYWWRWINQCTYTGPYQEHVWRSALVLKLLTYAPTGALVAAPTTSLPEWIGGERNWDYRYTWVRDASFTLYALFQLGFHQEATDFMHWVSHLTINRGLKILYNLDGHPGGEEVELTHLEGYRGSRPVRIGNGAEDQVQLDVYGELLDTVFVWVLNGGKVTAELWKELRAIVNFACTRWRERDAGLWEVRGEYLDFTYSKAMCWVALDRGIRIAHELGLPAELEVWEKARRQIHAAVVKHGFSKRLEAFTQSFGSDELDASALRLIQLGFLPESDWRLRSTIDAVDAGLSVGPLVFRYRAEDTDDGFSSPEGSFIICAFWLADALALVGDLEQAQRRFERLLAFCSPWACCQRRSTPPPGRCWATTPRPSAISP